MVQHIKNIIQGLKDFWYSEVWVLEGQEVHSRKSCTLLYSGSEVHKNYIAHLVFKDKVNETHLGRRHALGLSKLLRENKSSHDMVAIEGLKLHRMVYKGANDFFIPLWLSAKTQIPLKATIRSTKDEMRRMRKHQLDYKIATTEQEYEHFYQDMYVPTMAKRHDDRTIAMSYDNMLQKLIKKQATLLFITMDNKAIAGTVMRHGTTCPILWSTGILDGNPDYWKTGVTSAGYVFSAQYAVEQGHKELDMGLSRPFLSDGVLQYKKKWNAEFSAQGQRGFILKINRFSEAVKSFFAQHPFAFVEEDKLYGAVVLSVGDILVDTVQQLHANYYINGLEQLRVFTFKTNESRLMEILDTS